MKKIIGISVLLLIAINLAFTVPAFAATEVLVEGEKYSSITSGRTVTGVGGASNSAFVLIDYPYTPNVTLEQQMATYKVDIPEAGTYTIFADVSQPKEAARCDWSIVVNDETPLSATMDAVNLGIKELSKYNTIIYKMQVGSAYFNKGINTMRFVLDMSDVNSLSTIQCAIDCFRIVKDDFGVERVKPKELGNIFEENQGVIYDVLFKGESYEEHTFKYEIEDFWTNIVKKGEIVSAPGARKMTMNLGDIETGWYKFKIYAEDGATLVVDKPFTVVPEYDTRYKGETPFAADCGAEMRVAHGEQSELVTRSMRLAGVQWVRDRLCFGMTEYTKGKRTDHLDEFLEDCQKNGLDVLNCDSGLPPWMNVRDLFSAYDYYREQAARYKDKIDMWEIFNEYDAQHGKWTGDVYSPYYKAVAIAIDDSKSNAALSMNSLCMSGNKNNMFLDLMLQNGLMNYSDIYNFHAHVYQTDGRFDSLGVPKTETYFDNQIANFEDRPMWATEQGMHVPLYEDVPNDEQQRSRARFTPTSTAQMLSLGADKNFWFLWRTYLENGHDLSIYDTKNNEPYPAYTASAIVSHVLGKGEFKGVLDVEDAQGYVFDSGSGDVLVVWTELPKRIKLRADKDVVVTDIMGQSKTVSPINGFVEIEVSHYAVYVRYGCEMPLDDYYPKTYNRPELKRVGNYTPGQRVVIGQEFPGADLVAAKLSGYTIQDKSTTINLLIYNINNKEMTGKICASLDGYDIILPGETVTIPAMSQITVPVTLEHRDDDDNPEAMRYLRFYMDFDGDKSSESVSKIKVVMDSKALGEAPDIPFTEIMEPSNWHKHNRAGGTNFEVEREGHLLKLAFTNSPPGVETWLYPMVDLKDSTFFADTSGLVFEYKNAPESIGPGGYNVFLYLTDGRSYYLGSYTTFSPSETWKRVEVKWDEFVLWSSPLGAFEVRELDPTLINQIAIGGNFVIENMYYEFRNIGFSKKEEKADDISISIPDGTIESNTDASKLSEIKITMDEKFVVDKTRVVLEDVDLKDVVFEGNTAIVDLSYLTKGDYVLRVIGVDKGGNPIQFKKKFRIDQ